MFILFAAMLLTGCNGTIRYRVSQQQMEDVLYDMHRTEGIIQARGGLINTSEGRAYYANTLAKHGLTPEEFDSAVVWYTAHPEAFIRIYGHVVSRLDKEKERLRGPSEKYPYMVMMWENPLAKWGYKPYETAYEVINFEDIMRHKSETLPGPVGKRRRKLSGTSKNS